MKKFLAIAFAAMMSLGTMAQTAQQVLDKTAAVIGNKKGATAIEYGLIAALISIGLITGLGAFSTELQTVFERITTAMRDAWT